MPYGHLFRLEQTPSSSSRSTMDELQSPSSNKKRKSVVTDSGQRRRLAKKIKIAGDIARTSRMYSLRVSYHRFTLQSSFPI